MPCSIHPQWLHDAIDCPMCKSIASNFPPLNAATLHSELRKAIDHYRAGYGSNYPMSASQIRAFADRLANVAETVVAALTEAAAPRPVAAHAPDCDVSTGKHARGSWDDLELPGDCTCGVRKPTPPPAEAREPSLTAQLDEARQWITAYLNTGDTKGLPSAEARLKRLTAQVRALQGGCGCIYGGPGIGLDTECAVHRQAREKLEAQVQALTERLNAAWRERDEQAQKGNIATEAAWQQAIAVVEQGIKDAHITPQRARIVLAALRAKSEGK